jgi:hypothetical protein
MVRTLTKARKEPSKFLSQIYDQDRFFKRPDGWIKDNLLGLDWGPSSGKRMEFEEAQEYCAKLGARLPELRELHSLVDYTKANPAVHDAFKDDTRTDDWYWTATEVKKYPSCAWCVAFLYGIVLYYGKDDILYVRPVRASQ